MRRVRSPSSAPYRVSRNDRCSVRNKLARAKRQWRGSHKPYVLGSTPRCDTIFIRARAWQFVAPLGRETSRWCNSSRPDHFKERRKAGVLTRFEPGDGLRGPWEFDPPALLQCSLARMSPTSTVGGGKSLEGSTRRAGALLARYGREASRVRLPGLPPSWESSNRQETWL